jgi:predicted lipoprotein with Yx(FWY)xxD motif
MHKHILTLSAFAALALAACGGGGSSGGGGGGGYTPPTPAPSSAPASQPTQASVAGAAAWVSSSNAHTLYTFQLDMSGVSNCTSANGCTGTWPPYAAPAGTVAPSGSGFGIITRSDGTLQWTYSGFPLYMYAGDTAAGQDFGQGLMSFGGKWAVSRPASASGGNPGGCVGYNC